METKIVTFTERFFAMMIWVILVLIAAGFIFKFASQRGIVPAFWQKIGALTNLQAQAGS